ncbi:hypothetical protein [Rickettsia endosymbiont of Cardiosporidium cionae]|nr:hypothetical protein [Rickettsia endosymbiont of Cardiosporidium cionae]KAF8818531.1 hypothetical protein IHI24_000245 [Rickettsia endosymbiont of Cardiosporidium cionae]
MKYNKQKEIKKNDKFLKLSVALKKNIKRRKSINHSMPPKKSTHIV